MVLGYGLWNWWCRVDVVGIAGGEEVRGLEDVNESYSYNMVECCVVGNTEVELSKEVYAIVLCLMIKVNWEKFKY